MHTWGAEHVGRRTSEGTRFGGRERLKESVWGGALLGELRIWGEVHIWRRCTEGEEGVWGDAHLKEEHIWGAAHMEVPLTPPHSICSTESHEGNITGLKTHVAEPRAALHTTPTHRIIIKTTTTTHLIFPFFPSFSPSPK